MDKESLSLIYQLIFVLIGVPIGVYPFVAMAIYHEKVNDARSKGSDVRDIKLPFFMPEFFKLKS